MAHKATGRGGHLGKRRAFEGALLIGLLLAWLSAAGGEVVERVVGTIGQEVYTVSDLREAAGRFGLRPPEGSNPLDQRLKEEAFLKEAWERLVEEKVLEAEAKRLGIDVKDEEVEEVLKGLRERHRISEREMAEELAAQGFTLDGYRRFLKTQMRKSRIVEALIRPRISTADEDLLAYYDRHRKRYSRPTQVRVYHIFIALPEGATSREKRRAEQRLERVLAALERGDPFEDVARLYSQDPSAKYGGDMGYLSPKEVDPELWNAITELGPGEIGPVVRSSRGFHIFMVTDRRGERPLPFHEVKERVLKDYLKDELERRYREWLTEAKERVGVETLL